MNLIDEEKSKWNSLFINSFSEITASIKLFNNKIIKTKFENKIINKFNDPLSLYRKLKIKLQNKIMEFKSNNSCFERNRCLNISDIVYPSVLSEGLNKSFADVTNKLSIKKMVDFSTNSFIDKKNTINKSELYDQLINVLLDYLKDDLCHTYKILAMDGTNLALNKKLSEYNYAYQTETKTVDKYKIKIYANIINLKLKILVMKLTMKLKQLNIKNKIKKTLI